MGHAPDERELGKAKTPVPLLDRRRILFCRENRSKAWHLFEKDGSFIFNHRVSVYRLRRRG